MEIPTNWTFKNRSVAEGFDRHVREQLPWYDLMSGAVAHVARHYIGENGRVYDLGCSTGNIGNLLIDTLDERNVEFHPVDNAEEMREMYVGPSEFELLDIRYMDFEPFDVAISFLCLMFMSPSQRRLVLDKLVQSMKVGGAIIIVDKMEAEAGYLGTVMNRLTLAGKTATGVSADDIITKELSLVGAQRPMSRKELPAHNATEIFRFGEFAGWVIQG